MESPSYKLVLFGKSEVGKTSLFDRIRLKSFDLNTMRTTAITFTSRTFPVDGHEVLVQIWDTAGQERYAPITNSYFHDASGGLLVFDLTNAESLLGIEAKVKIFKETAKPGAKVVLVGNKKDLEKDREVTKERAEALARTLETSYVETSAKDASNVERAFALCVEEVSRAIPAAQPKKGSVVLQATVPHTSHKSKCCK